MRKFKEVPVIILFLSFSLVCYTQNLSWVKSIGGAEYYDNGTSIVSDHSGNVYLGGNFKGTVTFGDGSIHSSFGGTDMFLSKYNSIGECIWTRTFGGVSNGAGAESDILNDIVLDTLGNIYVVGKFMENCDFGDTNLTMIGSLWNGFIAKYNSSGNLLWVQKIASNAINIKAITVDPNSNDFFITGDLNANATFGTINLNLTDYGDVFIVRYNAQGTALWARQGSGEQAMGNEITCDENGNIYVIGDALGTDITFDGITINTNSGSNDIFIVKYTSTGNVQWLKTFGGIGDVDFGLGICNDLNGNIYATGKIEGLANFGSNNFDAVNQGSFLCQLDQNGNVNWLTGGKTGTWGVDVGTDEQGNVYWYGTVYGSTQISDQSVFGDGGDIFIAQYTENGDLTSMIVDGGPNQQGSNSGRTIAMTVDQYGFAYVTGQYYQSANFVIPF